MKTVACLTVWISVAAVALSGCSLNRVMVDKIGDALSESGSVFTTDPDPELVRDAIPFGLKMYEGLLASSPRHRGLLLSAAKGFTAYAYLLGVQADTIAELDYAEARRQSVRASRLFLRGRDYALKGLELNHPRIGEALLSGHTRELGRVGPVDVDFLYWTGVSWAGAASCARDDTFLIAELPMAAALVERVIELDDSYQEGAAHEFFITLEASLPGGSLGRAREHYLKAVEYSGGNRASVHLALAEAVAVREQDLAEFRALLDAALAVDVDAVPEMRLENSVAQRRARWLAARLPDYFVNLEEE